jgi:hypothetical protein
MGGASDVAEVDAAVPLDAGQDGQEGDLEAGEGRGIAGRAHIGDLRLGTAPAGTVRFMGTSTTRLPAPSEL